MGVCKNGAELLRMLEQAFGRHQSEPADLVITAVGLPSVDGLSILAGLATTETHCPVVLLVASHDNEAQLEAMRLCSVAVFVKPLDLDDLVACVETVVERRQEHVRAGVAGVLSE